IRKAGLYSGQLHGAVPGALQGSRRKAAGHALRENLGEEKSPRGPEKGQKVFVSPHFFLTYIAGGLITAHGVNFLAMCVLGNELEPGPSRLSRRQKMTEVVKTRRAGRRESAVPYAVGWGGFAPG